MLEGPVRLDLMIGPAVPIPAPREVIEALTGVSITILTDQPSGFQLDFALSTRSPLHTLFLLSGGASIPLVRVVIIATVNGSPEVLMDGVMTDHQVVPGSSAGQASLRIIGEDLSRVMDYIDFSGIPYPAMPPEARVLLLLAKYAVFGVVPMVIPSVLIDVPIPTEQIPVQTGKDLAYIRWLAAEVGYVFYVDPGPLPGASIAYWGPQVRVGMSQPALNLDMDAHRNVESLSFRFQADRKALPVLFIQNQETRVTIPIPVPDITPLSPPLGLVPPIPKAIHPIDVAIKYSPVRAAIKGLAEASKFADAVFGTGSLDVVRYGRPLKARRLVGVRGAGLAFDGLYYVANTTHTIKRGEWKQSFELVRNGLVSTVDSVPTA